LSLHYVAITMFVVAHIEQDWNKKSQFAQTIQTNCTSTCTRILHNGDLFVDWITRYRSERIREK